MSAGFFQSMLTVVRKELLDITRDRRTLALAVLMTPLLIPLMMLGMISLGEKRMKTQQESELELPVFGAERAPNLVGFLASQRIRAVEPPEDIAAAIASQQVDVALEIGESFEADWRAGRPAPVVVISDASRRNAEMPVQRVRGALRAYGDQMGALRLVARGIDPSIVRPLGVGNRNLASEVLHVALQRLEGSDSRVASTAGSLWTASPVFHRTTASRPSEGHAKANIQSESTISTEFALPGMIPPKR